MRRISLCLSLVVALALPAVAQRGGTNNAMPHTCDVRGKVRYSDGRAGERGIAVTLETQGGGVAQQSQTDSSGKFSFEQVPCSARPSLYEVHIRAVGYQPDFQDVDLTAMPSAYLMFSLKPDMTFKTPAVPAAGPGATVSAAEANIPASARKNFQDAEQLLQSGNDFDQALALLKKAVAEYPLYSDAYLVLGVAYSSHRNWADAENALQQAIKANDNNAAAYVALGAVKNETQSYDDAAKYLLKAVQLAPESADAHLELGRSYYAQKNWQSADAELTKANALRPTNASQRVLMGNVLLRERNAPGALREFQEAVRLDPDGPMAAPAKDVIQKIETALQQSQVQPPPQGGHTPD